MLDPDQDDNDAHIEPPESVDHQYCPKCQRILPRAEFRRKVTNALARAWGYHSARDVPFKYWKECHDCAPPPVHKTPKTMGAKQLVREAQKGNIPLGLLRTREDGKTMMDDADERRSKKMAGIAFKVWHQKWTEPWRYARQRLRKERRVTYFRVKYNQSNPVIPTDERDPHDCATQTRALVEFYTLYAQTLDLLIDHMTAKISDYRASREARRLTPTQREDVRHRSMVMNERSEWSHYLHTDIWDKLVWAWRAIDPDLRTKRCRSNLLMMLNDNFRLCLYGYTPGAPRTEEEKEIARIQAERIEIVKEAAARALQRAQENDDENL